MVAAAPLPLMGDATSWVSRTAQDVESGHISLQGVRVFAIINLLYMFFNRPRCKMHRPWHCTIHPDLRCPGPQLAASHMQHDVTCFLCTLVVPD